MAQGDSTLVGRPQRHHRRLYGRSHPHHGGGNAYIIYILDNKDTVTDLNSQLFLIIMQALVIGLLISVLLSFLLSKTMVGPIEKLTAGAERVAAGDFDSQLPVESTDEIGIPHGHLQRGWPMSFKPRWPPWRTSGTSWTPCSST